MNARLLILMITASPALSFGTWRLGPSTSKVTRKNAMILHSNTLDTVQTGVKILPAKRPLNNCALADEKSSSAGDKEFSILSWNILLPNSQDNWWNHKMYASWVPMAKREWTHRHSLIQERILLSEADIVCIQEANGETFEKDFAFMEEAGYNHCLHNKFRFRCATFFKKDKFVVEEIAHKDRTLVTSLKSIQGDKLLNVVNSHLSGGAAPERRLRQVFEGLDQIRKWKNKAELTLQKQLKANRPSPKNIQRAEKALKLQENAGTIVCGDFNSDGNTGVRRLLVEGLVDPEWREPQYPNVSLTSKRKELPLGHTFVDAAELAYAANVCDGDYGEGHMSGQRPATYVVPNLAKLLLLPEQGADIVRTHFGQQVARGVADTLGLRGFCENEMDRAFESIDLDGNNLIDQGEVKMLLESAYVATYGRQIEETKRKFFSGFRGAASSQTEMAREHFTEKLLALQQKLEEGSNDTELEGRVARVIADTLGLHDFCQNEVQQAFESLDLDGNNLIDDNEVQMLLEQVFLATYGQNIEKQRDEFFALFQSSPIDKKGLSREQFAERLVALQQELEGGSKGAELVEIRTEADAQRMISRFTPILKSALDQLFDEFSGNGGETLSKEEVEKFLIKTNGQLGRGGTQRHTAAIFKKKTEASEIATLTRQEWYSVFARELSEGKWWQVVYDLDVCGVNLRQHAKRGGQHYQGWLDYVYFDSRRLECTGVQDALTASEMSKIFNEGDALPNEWHPSDHLPVAAIFSWN